MDVVTTDKTPEERHAVAILMLTDLEEGSPVTFAPLNSPAPTPSEPPATNTETDHDEVDDEHDDDDSGTMNTYPADTASDLIVAIPRILDDATTLTLLHAQDVQPIYDASAAGIEDLMAMIPQLKQRQHSSFSNENQQVMDELRRISGALILLQQQQYYQFSSAACSSKPPLDPKRAGQHQPASLVDPNREPQRPDPPAHSSPAHRRNVSAADPPAATSRVMMQLLWQDAAHKVQNTPEYWLAESLSPAVYPQEPPDTDCDSTITTESNMIHLLFQPPPHCAGKIDPPEDENSDRKLPGRPRAQDEENGSANLILQPPQDDSNGVIASTVDAIHIPTMASTHALNNYNQEAIDESAMTVIMTDAMEKLRSKRRVVVETTSPPTSSPKYQGDRGVSPSLSPPAPPENMGDDLVEVSLDQTPGAFRMTALYDESVVLAERAVDFNRRSAPFRVRSDPAKLRPRIIPGIENDYTSASTTPGSRARAPDPPEIRMDTPPTRAAKEPGEEPDACVSEATGSGLRLIEQNPDGSGGSVVLMRDVTTGEEVVAHVSKKHQVALIHKPSNLSKEKYDSAIAMSLSVCQQLVAPEESNAGPLTTPTPAVPPPMPLIPLFPLLIPLVTKSGRQLSTTHRIQLAHKLGVCARCFAVETHRKTRFLHRRTAITNDRVFQGHCILCEPEDIPPNVLTQFINNYPTAPIAATEPHLVGNEKVCQPVSLGIRDRNPVPLSGPVPVQLRPVVQPDSKAPHAVPPLLERNQSIQQAGVIPSPVSAEIVSDDSLPLASSFSCSNTEQIQRLMEAVTSLQEEINRRVPEAEVVRLDNNQTKSKNKTKRGCIIM